MSIVCLNCKNPFHIPKYRKDSAKYCSKKCKNISQIGIPRSEDIRRRISINSQHKKAWNKGLTKLTDTRLAAIGMAASHFHGGKRLSIDHRRKISAAHKKIINWNYKGGVSPVNKMIRKSIEYKQWRESVFKRDNYICWKCGTRGLSLHPHHVLNFGEFPELRFDVDNGITLCEFHHREFHKTFGQTKNTKEQIEEYINAKPQSIIN